MRLFRYVLLGSILILPFTGCSVNSTPACSDVDVKSLVLEISEEESLKQVFGLQLQSKMGAIPASAIYRFSIDRWKNNPPKNEEVATNFTFERSYILEIIAESEQLIRDANMQLEAIRVDNMDEDLEKSSCSANLKFSNGNQRSITYTAQNTEDGQLYVEVSGL